MLASHSAGRCLGLPGRRRANEPVTLGGRLGAPPDLDGVSGGAGLGILYSSESARGGTKRGAEMFFGGSGKPSIVLEREGLEPGEAAVDDRGLGVGTRVSSCRERGGTAAAVEEVSVSFVVLPELRMTASNS
jgi:hypothetical protein